MSNTTTYSFITAALLLGAVLPTSSAKAQTSEAPRPAQASSGYTGYATRYVGRRIPQTPATPGVTWNAVKTTNPNSWMDSKIDIDFRDTTIEDAMRKIVERTKVGFDRVQVDFALPKDLKVTLKAKNVTARDVMASVARLGGAVAWVTTQNNKVSVNLRPYVVAATAPVLFTANGQNSVSIDTQRRIEQAMRAANDAKNTYTRAFTFFGRPSLPDRRVTLDVKSTDIREALKTVLKQANFDYALEDDVPDDTKKSFTFENVPIETALDVICESAGIGWTAERSNIILKATPATTPPASSEAPPSGDKATPVPAPRPETREVKYTIRIGKKYAGKGVRRNSSNFFPPHTLDHLDFLVPALPPHPEPADVVLPVPPVAPPPPVVPPVSNETL